MKKIIYFTICFFISVISFSQNNFTISGYVKDKNSGEVLIGATVYEKELYRGTTTNSYGYYSFSLPEGDYTLYCSYIGYENQAIEIKLAQSFYKDIFLDGSSISLDVLTVTAESSTKTLTKNEFNTEKITMGNIRQLPAMFGEPDAIKAIQLQSGVKTIGDGSSGMFVRGGGSDQNLILIDEAPIYNPSHLFGLISIFNPDALNHIDLYKSNMPAQYGGRVSSVIDCKMKEGNMYEHNFSVGLSPFSTILTANGPIIKEKSSFFVSGRKSLVDLFFKPGANLTLVPGFYDLNIKLNTKIGNRDRLFVSFYNGEDLLESADGFFNKWGNTSGTIRWNSNLGSKTFLNTSFIISNYQNYIEFNENGINYKWLTGLNDKNLKIDLSYYVKPGNVLKVGIGSIYHQFTPGETSDIQQSIPRIEAFEHSFYFLNDIELFSWFGINYGMRLSAFQNYGKATWFDYDEHHLPTSININNKGVYNTYIFPEPRVSTNFKFSPNHSLKIGYARNAQYMQALQNNSLSYSSLETWFPANKNIKPIIADIISAGWFQNVGRHLFLSAEMYYKTFQNQIDFVDHAQLINNPYIEGEIRAGTAKAYGAELNLKTEINRFTNNISYSYSRALRKIDEINGGKEFNSPYDIPHDFRIVTNYKINNKWSFNNAWLYMSGRPVTLPVGFYKFQNNVVPIYSDRNSSRYPDYHRLDIAFNYNAVRVGKINWSLNFGLFNVYARKNPLGYEFSMDTTTSETKVYQYTLFTILPNFSIKAEF